MSSLIILTPIIAIILIQVHFYFSMKPTRELAKLNKIWERFNNNEDIEKELNSIDWKYHKEKVDLLNKFIQVKNKYS